MLRAAPVARTRAVGAAKAAMRVVSSMRVSRHVAAAKAVANAALPHRVDGALAAPKLFVRTSAPVWEDRLRCTPPHLVLACKPCICVAPLLMRTSSSTSSSLVGRRSATLLSALGVRQLSTRVVAGRVSASGSTVTEGGSGVSDKSGAAAASAEVTASKAVPSGRSVPLPDGGSAVGASAGLAAPAEPANFSGGHSGGKGAADSSPQLSWRDAAVGVAGALIAAAAVLITGNWSKEVGQDAAKVAAEVGKEAAKAAVEAVIATVKATSIHDQELAACAAGFEARRLDAIKKRILEHPLPTVIVTSKRTVMVPYFERPEVTAMLRVCSTDPMVLIAPKGDGKSTAMRAWAHTNPYLIYIDVSEVDNYSDAVKALADAIGYAPQLSDEEYRARKSGLKLPDMDVMTSADLKGILALYKRACRELRDEGKLDGKRVPTLVLDHSTRPLTKEGQDAVERIRNLEVWDLDLPPQAPRAVNRDTLIRAFLDAAKDTEGECLLAIVTSDVYAQQGAISASRPWDKLVYRRLPQFSEAAAKKLLAGGIKERLRAGTALPAASPSLVPLSSVQQQPGDASTAVAAALAGGGKRATSEEQQAAAEAAAARAEDSEARIKAKYADTIDLLIQAVGCRPRRLLTCLTEFVPMTDAELRCRAMTRTQLAELAKQEGLSPVERAWIDKAKGMADVELAAAKAEVQMPEDLKRLLPAQLHEKLIAPTVAAKLKGELESFERAINKMLAVPHDIVVPPFTSPTLTSNERLLGRVLRVDTLLRQLQAGPQRRVAIEDAFTGCEAVLERLLSFHVLFLDGSPKEGTIGFESAAMRHIAAAVLESRPHQARVELARTLLEWQKASAAAAELSSRSRSIWGWLGDAVGLNISKAAVADARVESLAAKIERLRPLVPLSPGIKSEAPALMEGSGD